MLVKFGVIQLYNKSIETIAITTRIIPYLVDPSYIYTHVYHRNNKFVFLFCPERVGFWPANNKNYLRIESTIHFVYKILLTNNHFWKEQSCNTSKTWYFPFRKMGFYPKRWEVQKSIYECISLLIQRFTIPHLSMGMINTKWSSKSA